MKISILNYWQSGNIALTWIKRGGHILERARYLSRASGNVILGKNNLLNRAKHPNAAMCEYSSFRIFQEKKILVESKMLYFECSSFETVFFPVFAKSRLSARSFSS